MVKWGAWQTNPRFDARMSIVSQPHWALLGLIWVTSTRLPPVYYILCRVRHSVSWTSAAFLGRIIPRRAWGMYMFAGDSVGIALRLGPTIVGLLFDA